MSPKRSLASYNLLALFCRYRSISGANHSQRNCSNNIVPIAKLTHVYSTHKGLHLITANNGPTHTKPDANMVNDEKEQVQPPAPPPPQPTFRVWARWVLGSIFFLLLPFWKLKWEKFQRIEGEAEEVAEVVEKVASVAEKVSAEVAEKFPDNCKTKEAALFVERASAVVAKDAQLTKDFIHKVDALKQDLEDLETMIEPVIDKIADKESSGK